MGIVFLSIIGLAIVFLLERIFMILRGLHDLMKYKIRQDIDRRNTE